MKTKQKPILEEIQGTVNEIISQVKKLIREGNARRVIIKDKNGKTLFQSQLTIGVAGTVFLTSIAPIISAITMFVLFASDAKVLVEKEVDTDDTYDEYEVEAEVIEIEDETRAKIKKKPVMPIKNRNHPNLLKRIRRLGRKTKMGNNIYSRLT
ncbi:MAG TPA: DUF4342 domain-containing protein [Balneolaceae bacterium]|nr:DUF4342 domain-containing protein [Balneolaceae bacterium]